MLKAMLPTSTLLGVLFAVPMSADEQPPRTLEEALVRTTRTLEVLRGRQESAAEPADPRFLRVATEPPVADPDERVARLESLGAELDRLQSHLELLRSGVSPAALPLPGRGDDAALVPTVGLRDGDLQRLLASSRAARGGELDDAAPEGPATQTPAVTPTTRPAPTAPEPEPAPRAEAPAAEPPAPNADGLAFSKARAAYFAGQYDRALTAFEALTADARSNYWRARCLEQLGRLQEALDLYDAVLADPGAGDLAPRAKGDADFLRWKIDFENGGSGK